MTPAEYLALSGPDSWGRWSHADQLAGAQIDTLRRIEWWLAATNSKRAPQHPEPYPRPGVTGGLLGNAQPGKPPGPNLRNIAELKARQRAMGANPTEEQIQEVLDEMTGGDDE